VYVKSKADFACNFFEKVLKHSGDFYGKPFLLAPWQEMTLSKVFGEVDTDGNRVIEMVYLEVPKKAGKSEFAAGIILFVLFVTQTPGCQIYGAASATRQALNVYRAAATMVEQSSALKQRLRVLRSTNRIVKRSDPESFYAAIAADGDLGDGVNPSFVVADEVHRWKTRKQLENWDVLSNGGITRRQTTTVAITTAGVQTESPLAWRLHEKTLKINRRIVEDPKFFGRIWGAEKTDDPSAVATWIKANPSLKENGGFLDLEKIREKFVSHSSEGDLSSFKRYFLNIWDQKEDLAIDMVKYEACTSGWKAAGMLKDSVQITLRGRQIERNVRPLPAELVAHFIDRRCWAGVDLSMTTDTSSVVFLFERPDGGYDALPFFWLPDQSLRKMELRLGVPLQRWADEGFLELSPGNVIDYRDIKARLQWGAQMFQLQKICWDPWNSRQISVEMIDEGHQCCEVRQGYATLSEPTKKVIELIQSGKFGHGEHPIMRWHAGCAATVTDGKDNKLFTKPDRDKSANRIDGLAATVNALSEALIDLNRRTKYTGIRVL
jgi:phage terminase large subunit-like protein